MNTIDIPVDAAVRERDAVLAYLEKTRDVWRDRGRATPNNKTHETICRAKMAVLDGVIEDIRGGFHVAEAGR